MAKLIVISWRDVPAQVLVKLGRETAKVFLKENPKVAESIGKAIMKKAKEDAAALL